MADLTDTIPQPERILERSRMRLLYLVWAMVMRCCGIK